MWPGSCKRAAIAPFLLLALASCDASSTPPPAELAVGPVILTSDPLAIRVDAPVPLDQAAFVEIGTVAEVDPTHYYDPRDRDPEVAWHAPTRAVALDGDWFVLDDGTRLRLGADGTGALLELDASHVPGAVLVRLVLPRLPDEPQFGFGEVGTGANAAGQIVEMQLRVDDAYASGLNETHAPVPLALWPARGAGVFVADRRPGAFDVGATRPTALLATFTLPARGPLAAHLFVSGDPAIPGTALALVRAYTALTAPPAVPPRWAFAPMQWRNVGTRAQVLADAQAMRDLGIPGSTVWIDNPWQTAYNTFEFDPVRYADAAALIADLEARGYHVLLWSTPYVGTGPATAADYEEAADRGYLVTDEVGVPIPFPWQNGPGGMIDFTAPGATAWWQERIQRATALGTHGFKLDFGEEILPELTGNLFPARTVGGDASVMHRLYARGYHDAYRTAAPDQFLITRAGTWGEQDVNTALWPGDLDNDLRRAGDDGSGTRRVGGLPAAIACGLSLSASGYPFFGSDIGGYRGGPPDSETLVRWAEYAALGTIMQLGGGGGEGDTHNPWDPRYAAGAAAIYQRYARLHMDLVPLLWDLAQRAGADGTPVTRPTRLVYPAAGSDDDTFLVGDDVFVAPVVTAGATTRAVVLPPGPWIDWWTGALTMSDGRTAITAAAPLDTLPLWRAANAFVPAFARAADTLLPATAAGVTSYADPAYGGELAMRITPTGQPTSLALVDGSGAAGSLEGTAYSIQYQLGPSWHHVTFDLDARATTVGVLAAPTGAELDGADLPQVADEAGLFACTTGCWLWEPAAQRLRVRVVGDDRVRPLLIR